MSALLLPNEILSLPAQAARRLVKAGEGDCALLYLALLEGGDTGKALAALHWGQARLDSAYKRLVELELAAPDSAPVPPRAAPEEELPRYSRGDLLDAMEREPEFTALYREVERLLGRALTENDLRELYTVYDGLAMPAEVVLLLVVYMLHAVRRQTRKEGAVPRMPQIRREAFRWKRLGLDNAEAAEDYLRRQQQVDSREWDILSAVGVTEYRPAVEGERKYIADWVELGLSDQLIRLAYERTVYQKGQMNWPYMNKILLSWHQAGWHTPEQVKANDRPAKRPAPARGGQQQDYQPSLERIQKNAEWLDRFLEEQEKKGG